MNTRYSDVAKKPSDKPALATSHERKKVSPADEKAGMEIHPSIAPFRFVWSEKDILYFPETHASYNAGRIFLDHFFSEESNRTAIQSMRQYKESKKHSDNPDNLTTALFRLNLDGKTLVLSNGASQLCLLAPSQGFNSFKGTSLRAQINQRIERAARDLNQRQTEIFYIPITRASDNINGHLNRLRAAQKTKPENPSDAKRPCSERLILNALLKMSQDCERLSPLQGVLLSATNFHLIPSNDKGHYRTQACCAVCQANKEAAMELLSDDLRTRRQRSTSPLRNDPALSDFIEEVRAIFNQISLYRRRFLYLYHRLNMRCMPETATIFPEGKISVEGLREPQKKLKQIGFYLESMEWANAHMTLSEENTQEIRKILQKMLASAVTIKGCPQAIDEKELEQLRIFSQAIGTLKEIAPFLPINRLKEGAFSTWKKHAQHIKNTFLGITLKDYQCQDTAQIIDTVDQAYRILHAAITRLGKISSPMPRSRADSLILFHELNKTFDLSYNQLFAIDNADALSLPEWLTLTQEFISKLKRALANLSANDERLPASALFLGATDPRSNKNLIASNVTITQTAPTHGISL